MNVTKNIVLRYHALGISCGLYEGVATSSSPERRDETGSTPGCLERRTATDDSAFLHLLGSGGYEPGLGRRCAGPALDMMTNAVAA